MYCIIMCHVVVVAHQTHGMQICIVYLTMPRRVDECMSRPSQRLKEKYKRTKTKHMHTHNNKNKRNCMLKTDLKVSFFCRFVLFMCCFFFIYFFWVLLVVVSHVRSATTFLYFHAHNSFKVENIYVFRVLFRNFLFFFSHHNFLIIKNTN